MSLISINGIIGAMTVHLESTISYFCMYFLVYTVQDLDFKSVKIIRL